MKKDKNNLLSELNALGITATGRKSRSDKGKTRGPNEKPRSDKGMAKNSIKASSMSIYCRVRSRILNNNLHNDKCGFANDDYIDKNGIFKIIKRDDYTKEGYYQVISHGIAKQRTVKHIAGNKIDLEKYRFEALHDKMITCSSEMPDKKIFAQEINHTCAECWFDLFVRLYHIDEKDAVLWDYKHWRKDYEILKDEYLKPSFTFNIKHSPGSKEFCQEYADIAEQRRVERYVEISNSHEYKVMNAKIRDMYYSRVRNKYYKEVLEDVKNSSLSKDQITRLVNKQITQADKNSIETNTASDMLAWVNEKLRKEGY